MSSWSLLLARSGYEYDAPRRSLRFTPWPTPECFKSFFVGPEGWGSVRQTWKGRTQENEMLIRSGRFNVGEVSLDIWAPPKAVKVGQGAKPLETSFSFDSGVVAITFKQPTTITPSQKLLIELV